MVTIDEQINISLRKNKLLIILAFSIIAFTSSDVSAEKDAVSTNDLAWTKNQLTEKYMRSITKASCMNKSLNYLKSCDSPSCLKTIAGVTGDCVTWAQGSNDTFCGNYQKEYLDVYCDPMIDTPNCRFVLAIRYAMCQKE